MLSAAKRSLEELGDRLKKHAWLMVGILALLWGIEIADQLLSWDFEQLGIRPRNWLGLVGVICAPLLHDGFFHLARNSVPLFFLGWVVLLGGVPSFVRVTVLVALVSGLGAWLFGKGNTIHIGASGVIYGYMAFLLLRGFFEKSLRWVMVALIVGFTLYTVLGVGSGGGGDGDAVEISWSGHAFGFLGGILAAWLFYYRPREEQRNRVGIAPKVGAPPPPSRFSVASWFTKRG